MHMLIPHSSIKQNHYWGKLSLKNPKSIISSSIVLYQQAKGFSGKAARTTHSEVIVYSGDDFVYTFNQKFPYATWSKYPTDEILRGMEGDKPHYSILAPDWLDWHNDYENAMIYYRAMRKFFDSNIPQVPMWRRFGRGLYDLPELIGHPIWAIRHGLFGAKDPLKYFDLPWANNTCFGGGAKGMIRGTIAQGKSEQYLFAGKHRERLIPADGFAEPHLIDMAK